MAAPKLSKMVTDRKRNCDFVERFVRTHAPRIAAQLSLVFAPDLEAEEPLPDFLTNLVTPLKRLRRGLDTLAEADFAHTKELADDDPARTQRDAAIGVISPLLIRLRSLFRGAYGDESASRVGFETRIASESLGLLRQLDRVLRGLRDPDVVLPEALPGFAVTRESVIEALEPHYQELIRALGDVDVERAKAAGTQLARETAMEEFDTILSQTVAHSTAILRISGNPRLASRLRRSVIRSTRGSSGQDQSSGGSGAPPVPSPPAPVPSPPAPEPAPDSSSPVEDAEEPLAF